MTALDKEPENRQMVEKLKQTVLGKLPITVILFAATCVEGNFKQRVDQALSYLYQVIKIGNDASRTLFGIAAEIIQEEKIHGMYGDKTPSMDEIGTILSQGLQNLLVAVEAGVFARPDIIELMDHLHQLAYAVMAPESEAPERPEGVQLVLDAMSQMRKAFSESTEQEAGSHDDEGAESL